MADPQVNRIALAQINLALQWQDLDQDEQSAAMRSGLTDEINRVIAEQGAVQGFALLMELTAHQAFLTVQVLRACERLHGSDPAAIVAALGTLDT